jgi:tetratricopeptide (TPR) repeat protein
VRREAASAVSRLGDLLSATGSVNEALAERRRMLQQMERIVAVAPADLANIRLLGVAHQKLAQTLGNPNAPNVGDHAGALVHLEQAADIFARGIAAFPDNAIIRRNLAVVWSNSADVLVALDRPEDALDRLHRALAAFQALADADRANAAAQNDLAICLSKEGEILQQLGRHADALAAYARGLAIHQRLAAADPGNAALKAELASGNNRVATARTALGQRTDALAGHDRAVEISQDLRRANPDDVELQVALALAHLGRAEAYAQFGRAPHGTVLDLRAAERDYATTVAMLGALEQRRAIEGSDIETLARVRDALAKVRAELRDR